MEAFNKRLAEKTTEGFEIFIDYLDLARFPSQAHIDRSVQYLAEKYAEAPPDLLIPLGRAAVPFMVKYRELVAPRVPIIMASIPTPSFAEARAALANTVWVTTAYNFTRTLELARRLQPEARNLVFIGGASDYDLSWANDARRELEPYGDRYRTRYLVGLPYDEMLREVSQLSSDTIVIMSFVFTDGAGLPQVPPDVAAAVANVSAAPVYSPVSTFFGRGIVGGYMDSFEAHGVAAADLASEILSGKPVAALSQQTEPAHRYQVDARELERWGMSSRNLPADTVLSFRTPSVWQQYRDLVLAAALVFALQTGLVAILLIQRRRRRRAEDLLKESEERMTFTAASANVGLWQFDRASNQLWATEHCRALFGFGRDAPLTGDRFLAAIRPEDRDSITAWFRDIGRTRSSTTSADFRVAKPDGQERWLRVRARANLDGRSAANQVSGIFIDITEQKAAEAVAAEQHQEVAHLMRVSVLGELSGAIAHEINQPLTAIQLNAQAVLHLLAQEPPDLAEVRDAVDDIVHENNRASDVIVRLRKLLKKGERKSELVDLNELVKSTIALVHSEAIARRIAIEADLASGLPAIAGDPVQLQQVLLNLLMNAMDAMAVTPGALRRVTVATRRAQAGAVEVAVRDRGHGIEANGETRLFKPFYSSKDHGLGLGLTICATIAQAHGGKLTLANHADGGAVAILSLPADELLAAAE